MTSLTRFFLGCIAIAVLSLSGCATGPLSESSPGAGVVFGSNRSERALTEEGNPARRSYSAIVAGGKDSLCSQGR